MPSLEQARDGLEPAEDFLHPFALVLTNRVARMTSGALVDNSARLARNVWSSPVIAQFLHKVPAVVALVGSQSGATPLRWTVLGLRLNSVVAESFRS